MSHSKGYKCYNINCSSNLGKTLCTESGDAPLSCIDRVVEKSKGRIDREKWEPCEDCKSCDNCVNSGDYDPYEGYFGECASCDTKTHSNFSPENFCHHCGRPLTEEAWAELERRAFP